MRMQRVFSSIDEYLEAVPPARRALLQELRARIRAAVPGAEECISYRIPAFRLEGVVIAGFAATAKGGSYYPFSGRTLKGLASEVAAFGQTMGALHFSEEHPLPAVLVRKLLKARIEEAKKKSRTAPGGRKTVGKKPGKSGRKR